MQQSRQVQQQVQADVAKALDAGAPVVHDDFGTNECYVWNLDAGNVDDDGCSAACTISSR